MIIGDVEKDKINLKFEELDEEEFIIKEIDVTDILSKDELIEKINEIEIQNNEYLEIILVGNRNFEIDKYDILKYIVNNRIIKIKNKTKIAYDLEKIAESKTTLKGIFVEEMLSKIKKEELTEEEKNIIEKAIEIGIEALE